MNGHIMSPAVVFLTGFSGAGKTTIANALQEKLQLLGISPSMLDGDEIRKAIQLTGFDEESRKKHNLNVGQLAKELEASGKIVIVALISPYKDTRDQIRTMCNRFVEVHVSTPLPLCIERDPKGLYKKALRGEIKEFTGISSPYEPPDNPELALDTGIHSATACADIIIHYLKQNNGS